MAIEEIEKAVDEYVDKMTFHQALTYVRSNMKDYYYNVADLDEAEEFLETGRDTSVYEGIWG